MNFLKRKCRENKIDLPQEGKYAVGMVFLPRESDEDLECEGIFETILRKEKLKLLGWRDVEVDRNAIGEIAKGSEPLIKTRLFIVRKIIQTEEFERKLFIVRKKKLRKKLETLKCIIKDIFIYRVYLAEQ